MEHVSLLFYGYLDLNTLLEDSIIFSNLEKKVAGDQTQNGNTVIQQGVGRYDIPLHFLDPIPYTGGKRGRCLSSCPMSHSLTQCKEEHFGK